MKISKKRAYKDYYLFHNTFMDKITRKAQIVVATKSAAHQNKFLLLQTNEERGSYWQNCTGKVEDDEEFSAGALREVMEETGLIIDNVFDIIDLALDHHFFDRWQRNVHEKSYLIVVHEEWNVLIDPLEHGNFKWVEHHHLEVGCVKYPGNFEALKLASQKLRGLL